jgi:citrate lyase subunit beta/citryl-CoA lyase
MGLLGSIAGFRDLGAFERAAARARDLGCVGASCIHPDQVGVLNRVFSPRSEKVGYARRVVEAFEDGLRTGTASVTVDGRWRIRRSIVMPAHHGRAQHRRVEKQSRSLGRLR